MSGAAAAASGRSAGEMIKQYIRDFKVLADNPTEYWTIQIVNFLDSTAYFAMISIITLFLSDNIGFDDTSTGYVVTAFTMLVTISLFFTGFISDSLGIKRAVNLAMLLQGVTRTGVLLCGLFPGIPYREWIVVACLLLFSPGMAMGITVYQSANRRFSTKRSRGASFLLWYMIMNIGGVIGGLLITLVRQILEIDITYIFAFGAGLSYLAFLLSLFLIRRIQQVRSEDEEDEGEARKRDREAE